MATTTRAVFRQELKKLMGDYHAQTTTGAGDTDTFVDASLLNLPGGGDDDAFQEWYALITESGHTAEGEQRRVSRTGGYTTADQNLNVEQAYSAATGSGSAYELSRYDNDLYHDSINRALREASRYIWQELRDETLVVDNLLTNSDGETFSGGFTGWTEVGAGAAFTQETSIVKHGSNSIKIVSAAADAQMTQAPQINTNEHVGKTVEAKFWVWATAASAARIRLDWDGSNFENSDWHSGEDNWELLSVSATVPSTATQVQIILEVATGTNTAYFDGGWMKIDPIYRYTIPTDFMAEGPRYVSQQANEDEPDGVYTPIPWGGRPTAGRRLRLEGKGLLSQLSSDTDTAEIGEPQVRLVVTMAAVFMLEVLASPTYSAQQQRADYERARDYWASRVEAMIANYAMVNPPMGAETPTGAWHISADSSGQYLVFDIRRGGSVIA
ncbi:MAG: hypothetical protein GWN86_06980 [Desulfobacterales bacterium]|nr:hypothetical protein [Desulfobacterales bacterium]